MNETRLSHRIEDESPSKEEPAARKVSTVPPFPLVDCTACEFDSAIARAAGEKLCAFVYCFTRSDSVEGGTPECATATDVYIRPLSTEERYLQHTC
jgi:hypothetical protein